MPFLLKPGRMSRPAFSDKGLKSFAPEDFTKYEYALVSICSRMITVVGMLCTALIAWTGTFTATLIADEEAIAQDRAQPPNQESF